MIVMLVFLFGVGAVMGAYLAVTKLPGYLAQRKLDARLEEVTKVQDTTAEGGAELVKGNEEGFVPVIERFAAGSAQGMALQVWVEQSGASISLSALLLISSLCGVVAGFTVASALRMGVGWVLGGALGFALPFIVLKVKRKLDLIARALKAGHAFSTGLKMVADEMSEPIGPEFRKAFDEQNFGLPLKDSLTNLTVRIPLLDVRFFSTAVLIQRETGGNLAEILENLGHVVRERFKILRQVRVYTAHGRLTGYVLLGLPVFLAIALAFINPEHMQLLFRERMGHMMLAATAVMQTIGYFWIKQVVKIEV